MMKNKKNIIYLVISSLVLVLFSVGVAYAYFSSGVTTASEFVEITTANSYSFSSNISKQLSIDADKDNMTQNMNGWYYEDNATITINLDGNPGSYCYYDLTYTDEGDEYVSPSITGGGGLSLMESSEVSTALDSIGEETELFYPSYTDFASVNKLLAKGKITVVDGTSASYTIEVKLKWENLNSDQIQNAGKHFHGTLKVENIICNEERVPKNQLFNTSNNDTLLSGAVSSGLVSGINDIKEVYVVNLQNKSPETGVLTANYSASGDNSIIGWVENSNKLYIGGNEGVTAGASLSYALAYGNKIENVFLEDMYTKDTINMSFMFESLGQTGTLKELNIGNHFNTINVKIMTATFEKTGFMSNNFVVLDLKNKFDTSKVTSMVGMFSQVAANGSNFETIILGDKFDTTNVTTMYAMFQQPAKGIQPNFTGIDLGDKFDTSNVINMGIMFARIGEGSTKFESLNLGNKFDTSKVTNMYSMFLSFANGATNFKTFDLGDKFNTINVTNMYQMFQNYGISSNIISLDLGENFDTSNVTNMYSMFGYTGKNAQNFISLNLGNKFDTSNVTSMYKMFANVGQNSAEFTKLDLGNQFNTSKVTNMSVMFYNVGQNSMKFEGLNLGDKFDTSNVTNMAHMFYGTGMSASNFGYLNLGKHFNTSKVTNMKSMFDHLGRNSQKFVRLDLGNEFDTSNVTFMPFMFAQVGMDAPNFEYLNIGNKFNTTKVKSALDDNEITGGMHQMFQNVGTNSKLHTIDVSSFIINDDTGINDMFHDTISINTFILGPGWASANLTNDTFLLDENVPTTFVNAPSSFKTNFALWESGYNRSPITYINE